MRTRPEVTLLLRHFPADPDDALHRLVPLVYDELRRLAHLQRRRSRDAHLDTTALVHEAYFKLVDVSEVPLQNRSHFFGVAARAMRQVLVDHVRARQALKRGGGAPDVPLDSAPTLGTAPDDELLALHEALTRLSTFDPRMAQVVECRYFGGLSVEETAAALDLSPSTVKREWRDARLWLHREMTRDG